MSRCEEFKNKIDELVREFKDLTGEEIQEIFKELADGTLTYVYQLRTSKDICYDKEITDLDKIHYYKSPEGTLWRNNSRGNLVII